MVRAALMLRLVALFPVVLGWSRAAPRLGAGAARASWSPANGALLLALYRWAPLVARAPRDRRASTSLSAWSCCSAPGAQRPFLAYSVSTAVVVGLFFRPAGHACC